METMEATYQRTAGETVLDAPYTIADINESVNRLLDEEGWEPTDCNGITLFRSDTVTTVLVCMHPGSEIGENSIDGTVTIQVIEGEVALKANGDISTLHAGQVAMLNPGVMHSLMATDATVLLITNHVCG